MKHHILLPLLLVLLFSCQEREDKTITDPKDYALYIQEAQPAKTTSKYFELWNGKIKTDSTQMMALANVAGEYDRYFKNTGNIEFLKKSEVSLKKAFEEANINKESYARALARNYISQHRFKEALAMAEHAQRLGGGKKATQNLLFDVHMELGNYETAENYLNKVKNFSDFSYLIRLAKWNDYKGDLDTTISMMEKAKEKAEQANNRSLKLWSYTNMADYYGHAGRLEDAYNHYLMALELDSENAYAKKGIAWILYSHEKNATEAMRVLNSVTDYYKAPDYYLLKAEISEFLNNHDGALKNLETYQHLVANPAYGDMYNAYNVEVFLDDENNAQRALQLALKEVKNRPTPESYNLLAKTYLKMGETHKAIKIAEDHLLGKSFEPTVLMTLAEIYKKDNQFEKVIPLKRELAGAAFELGPMTTQKINAL